MEGLLVPYCLVWVFQKLLSYWDYQAQPSLWFTENALEKLKISSEWQLCEWRCLVDVRGQRRIGRLVKDDRKATITQITTKICRIPSLNAQHVKPWSRWATALQDYTGCRSCQLRTGNGGYNSHRITKKLDNRKLENFAWSDESQFLLQHSDGRFRICRKEHESMDPSCLVSMVQAGGGGVMVWGIFS